MKRRNAGSEKYRPLYSFDKKKNSTRQAKSGASNSKGSTLVESIAARISGIPVSVELSLKYAGTALATKGEIRTTPRKIGSNQ
jgi:hypothetical protein